MFLEKNKNSKVVFEETKNIEKKNEKFLCGQIKIN